MEVNIFQVDAFTTKPFGGNPAGVVTNSKGLKDSDMQKIANEMNLSETVFIRQLDDSYFRMRYFTPLCEVDLCGHATIAAIYTLAEKGYIKPIEQGIKKALIETKLGDLEIEIEFKNFSPSNIIMEQDTPRSLALLDDLKELLSIFNISEEDIGIGKRFINPEIISTGLPDIILPLKDKGTLDRMEVDHCNLKEYSNRLGVTGVHAFSMDKDNPQHIYARNFAPAVGIEEEAATGTANGALIYYLKKNGVLESNSIRVFQGESLNRPSIINCTIEGEEGSYIVKVGGCASIVLEGIIKF